MIYLFDARPSSPAREAGQLLLRSIHFVLNDIIQEPDLWFQFATTSLPPFFCCPNMQNCPYEFIPQIRPITIRTNTKKSHAQKKPARNFSLPSFSKLFRKSPPVPSPPPKKTILLRTWTPNVIQISRITGKKNTHQRSKGRNKRLPEVWETNLFKIYVFAAFWNMLTPFIVMYIA